MSLGIDPRAFEKAAAAIGVLIQLDLDDDCILVCALERKTGKPGSGLRVLRTLCGLADRLNFIVEIEHMNDEPRLGELYTSCGFVTYHTGQAITSMRYTPAIRKEHTS